MRKTLIKLAFTVACITASTGTSAASGCSIADLKLDCGNGSRAEIAVAFASNETADALRYPWFELERFKEPADLETFRRSFERHWKTVNRVARARQRDLRSGRMTLKAFNEWGGTYEAARANYDRALFFYRTLIWNGKTGKPAPAQ